MSNKIHDGTARIPVDAIAARVISKGVHYEREGMHDPNALQWDVQPPLRGHSHLKHAFLVGTRKGHLTVIGVLDLIRKASNRAVWVCRCDCGVFIGRRSKSLRNPRNINDACLACKNLAMLRARSAALNTNAHRLHIQRKAESHAARKAAWLAKSRSK